VIEKYVTARRAVPMRKTIWHDFFLGEPLTLKDAVKLKETNAQDAKQHEDLSKKLEAVISEVQETINGGTKEATERRNLISHGKLIIPYKDLQVYLKTLQEQPVRGPVDEFFKNYLDELVSKHLPAKPSFIDILKLSKYLTAFAEDLAVRANFHKDQSEQHAENVVYLEKRIKNWK
jgi:hypothetical protein